MLDDVGQSWTRLNGVLQLLAPAWLLRCMPSSPQPFTISLFCGCLTVWWSDIGKHLQSSHMIKVQTRNYNQNLIIQDEIDKILVALDLSIQSVIS